MRLLPALVLSVAVVACASPPSPVTERRDYWRARLARELHVGMSREQIDAWAASNHLSFSEDRDKQHLSASVEEVPQPRSLFTVCASWSITVFLTLDDSSRLLKVEARRLGNCL